jgi:hypothetical protein
MICEPLATAAKPLKGQNPPLLGILGSHLGFWHSCNHSLEIRHNAVCGYASFEGY